MDVETRDISLAGRILAAFPQRLTPEQQVGDALAELGGLATLPEANIIKLPNISASIPQLKAAIAELQSRASTSRTTRTTPQSVEEKDIRARYDRIKGSAVNPVLREGNSDRRAPLSVKNYARKHPHRNKAFAAGSKTRVATLGHDDFKSNEKSSVIPADDVLTIQHVAADGTVTSLKTGVKVLPGEIVDATFLSAAALDAFLAETLREAAVRRRPLLGAPQGHDDEGQRPDHLRPRRQGVLRRRVRRPTATRSPRPGSPRTTDSGAILAGLAVGRGRRRDRGGDHGATSRAARACRTRTPTRASRTCTCPRDVIVDASMPALIRNGGKLWGVDGGEDDTLAVIPDSSYAGVYQAVIDDVNAHGPLDPATIGTVPNVGLMAQAAEEYGSHDKTFEIAAAGVVQVVDADGRGRCSSTRVQRRRHLARDADQGHRRPRLGEARRHPRPRDRRRPPCSGSTRTARTTRSSSRRCTTYLARARHRRPHDRDPRARGGDAVLARRACARARTPSR